MDTKLDLISSERGRQALAPITHVYTDLDGTLLAPGGRLLTSHDGTPSSNCAEALVQLKNAGIEVVPVTGRNREQCAEITRLLDLGSFIGELGGIAQSGYGAKATSHYNLGAWANCTLAPGLAPGELPANTTPIDLIRKSGVIEQLFATFPGKLERHNPYRDNREVTCMLRGQLDMAQANSILATQALPLQLADNGAIHPTVHHLVDVDEIHVYHLMPAGCSKGAAVAADMQNRGIDPASCIAIGDAVSDVAMGDHTAYFVLAGNQAKENVLEIAQSSGIVTSSDFTHRCFTTAGQTIDGWLEFAKALLLSKFN
jgi:hydroxymethylpyrimidine pyrophosphatase-like HAD family hydrolase